MIPQDATLLRIFIGESDKMDGKPLYEWLVVQARARGLAGATVLRGMMGFGAHSKIIHTFKIERLSEDLPIVVEIVDSADNQTRNAGHHRKGTGAHLSRRRDRRIKVAGIMGQRGARLPRFILSFHVGRDSISPYKKVLYAR